MNHLASGAYRPGDSILHSLDSAIKLICFLLLLLATLTTDTPAGYTGMLLFTAALAYLAGLDAKHALSTVRKLWWLIILVLLSNFAFYAPEETFGAWWIFTPSYTGFFKGLSIALRIAVILVLANILSATSSSLKLLGAVETVLSPLKLLNIPVERFLMSLELSARLIPAIHEDAAIIRRCQMSRGVNFAAKGFFNKAETAYPLLLPVLISSFRRVDRLSELMEIRGYCREKTAIQVKMIKPSPADWAALLVCASFCAMQLIIL